MSASVIGRCAWAANRDSEGHRTFTLSHKIRTTDKLDGPYVVMSCPSLPAVGSIYNFGNDTDSWAFCYPDMRVAMLEAKDDNTLTWIVEQKFSTKPLNRCGSNPILNPVSEPMKVGGSFVKYSEEAVQDLNGNPFLSSSFELFRGKEIEFDANRPTVWIEQNVSTLGLDVFSGMVDCVNDSTLWNCPPRCVKLSNVVWERKVQMLCSYYYTRRFEFDINFNTFDRFIQDEGTKVLNGHWGAATGTGCTVNIRVSGSQSGNSKNPITSIDAIASAGTGYPASQICTLAITGGTGTGASIYVQTDSGGTVIGVATGVINGVDYGNGVANGGQGYTTATGVTTTGSLWVLDKIGGVTPNPYNPQHFRRYQDINGENSRVILDGRGQPAIGRRPGYFFAQKYPSVNMFLLNIPSSF